MITVSPQLVAHLTGGQTTIATILRVQRQDGQVFGFTDHDRDIFFEGLKYYSSKAYSQSAIEWTGDLSPSNLEINALIDGTVITKQDVEAGLWSFAQVNILLLNYADLTMGALPLNSGVMGQVEIKRNQIRAELRGLSQMMAQNIGEVYSPGCRAQLGDTRCKIDLTSLTFADVLVTSVQNKRVFSASSLTQTGPSAEYKSEIYSIPDNPYQITPLVPEGGVWTGDGGVTYRDTGKAFVLVETTPSIGQYNLDAGVYTFSPLEVGKGVNFVLFYTQGYFTYGKLTWQTGENEGYSADVWRFSSGEITLLTSMPFPIAVGDTFRIVAGCDKTSQMCKARFANIINFRGEPFLPGLDNIVKIQSKR